MAFFSATAAAAVPRSWDSSQQAVLDLPEQQSAAVIGAPGSGKTTILLQLASQRVAAGRLAPEELLVLAPSRLSAGRLRDQLALRVGVPTRGPLVRTATSLAFDVVRQEAARSGAAPPTLLTGGEQDAVIRELLAGHREDGRGPNWPDPLSAAVRSLPAFRAELRELMMRATDHGLSAAELAELGRRRDRPEWIAAAEFLTEYASVLPDATGDQLDSAELMAAAATAIAAGNGGSTVTALRLLLVDDIQEATGAALSLIRAIAVRGVTVLAFGDPDVATNAFRGGNVSALGKLGTTLSLGELPTLYLDTVHRQGPQLRALTAAVTARIGTASAGRQRAAASTVPTLPAPEQSSGRRSPVVVIRAPSAAQQLQAVARLLREHRLFGGVSWNRMTVVARSGAALPGIARALEQTEVPVSAEGLRRPLREEPAARSLLELVAAGIGHRRLTAEVARELLLSPYGGLDAVALRKLRLALRAEELAGGGLRQSDELLREALATPGRLASIDARMARSAERLAVRLAGLAERASAGASIDELLWFAWDGSGPDRVWRNSALAVGPEAREANRNLDGVLALFTAAKRFVERRPTDPASLFLDQVLRAEVAEDSLTARATADSVLVTTPAGLVGREFDVVAVVSLQDGVWPNLRLRGSLLHSTELADAVAGAPAAPVDARREVLFDELRQFALTVSRSARHVILAAVENDDEAASVLLALVPPGAETVRADAVQPLSLRALTGRLRRDLVATQRATAHPPAGTVSESTGPGAATALAAALARLASASVPGAHPESWHGLLDLSTRAPLFDLNDPDVTVPVSPSKLASFEESPLNWFIDRVAGSGASPAMGVGTVVHWVLETATDSSAETLWRAVELRWNEVMFESGWLAERQKRQTWAMVRGLAEYLADFERHGKLLVSAEGAFELDVGRARVRGTIDRVEHGPDGSVVIVDLKTGNPVTAPSQIDAHPQLSAYQLAYSAGSLAGLPPGHRSGGAKLLFVKSGKGGKAYRESVQAPLSAEQLTEFRERIESAAAAMAAAEFRGLREVDEYRPGAARYRLHIVPAVSSD